MKLDLNKLTYKLDYEYLIKNCIKYKMKFD